MRSLIPAAVLVLAFLVPAHAGSKDDARAKLDAGEIIVKASKVAGSDIPRAKAMGVVDAPAERIWKIIDRCADYHKTMIRTAASEELSRKGNKVRCRVTVELPFPLKNLTATTEATHTVVPGKKWERRWTLLEGDYTRNDGRWLLLPFGDDGARTLVIYEVHAEPKVAIPDAIQKAAQKKSLPKLIRHLRTSVAAK